MDHTNRLVLLAEDNNEEYVGFLRAINNQPENLQVMRLDDGYSLLNMLQTAIGPYAIFLDVNMPYKNGLATLLELREMERFKKVPVIMYSESDYKNNVELAYEFGASFFILKKFPEPRLSAILTDIFASPYFLSGTQPPRDEFFIGQ